jgi:hypothetical protein
MVGVEAVYLTLFLQADIGWLFPSALKVTYAACEHYHP